MATRNVTIREEKDVVTSRSIRDGSMAGIAVTARFGIYKRLLPNVQAEFERLRDALDLGENARYITYRTTPARLKSYTVVFVIEATGYPETSHTSFVKTVTVLGQALAEHVNKTLLDQSAVNVVRKAEQGDEAFT